MKLTIKHRGERPAGGTWLLPWGIYDGDTPLAFYPTLIEAASSLPPEFHTQAFECWLDQERAKGAA